MPVAATDFSIEKNATLCLPSISEGTINIKDLIIEIERINGNKRMPTVTISSTNATCNGLDNASAIATAQGGTEPYTYQWSNGATTSSIVGVTAGMYTVTVTDDTGAMASESVTITEPTALVATPAVDQNTSCNGESDGAVSVSVTGGTGSYVYQWSNGATTQTVTGLAAGTYFITVQDENGCTVRESIEITEPTALVATTIVDNNISCFGEDDGAATATASGGTPPYSYIWSNNATTASIDLLGPGNYTVMVTDANECTTQASVTITEPASALDATVFIDNVVSCNGEADGQITVMATGGTQPYRYRLDDGPETATNTFGNLASGEYMITVIDNNDCFAEALIILDEPEAIDTSITDASPTFTANATSATYQWINCDTDETIPGETNQSFTATENGNYAVDITIGGCTERSDCFSVQTLSAALVEHVQFTIVPNPAVEKITIHKVVNNVTIYTLTGKHVLETTSSSISVASLPAGVYFVRIQTEQGTGIQKLIKQ